MPNKRKTKKEADTENELWISPRFSLKGADGERGWEDRIMGPPNSSRFLELADIALGMKKPTPKKAKSKSVHETFHRTLHFRLTPPRPPYQKPFFFGERPCRDSSVPWFWPCSVSSPLLKQRWSHATSTFGPMLLPIAIPSKR